MGSLKFVVQSTARTYHLTSPPNMRSSDWFDRDNMFSMILQAIVDPTTRFIDVSVGFPGSVHDARVFQLSSYNRLVTNSGRLNGPTVKIQGVDIHELLIGDAGYTADVNMLVRWPGQRLPATNTPLHGW